MNRFLKLNFLPKCNLNRTPRKFKFVPEKLYSTQSAVEKRDPQDDNKELLNEYEKLSNISIKYRSKKPQKPPFVKNLFVGIFDTDLLTYPELGKSEYETLNKDIEPLERYFKQTEVSGALNLQSEFWGKLKQFRAIGLAGPQILDGRELNLTETCRFNEVLSTATSLVPGLLANHQIGMQIILKVATDTQKKKYLPQMIMGNVISAFCIQENYLVELNDIKTTATLSSDKKFWTLNGAKSLVVNGGVADLFFVVAGTEGLNRGGLRERRIKTFLVEKDFGGITAEPTECIGIDGTSVCDVKFNNTIVPYDNILGDETLSESILESFLTEFRLSTGPACSAILRKTIDGLSDHYVNSGKPGMEDVDHIKSTIAEITTSLYAVESITYLTSFLIDEYENQDCKAESAIVKIFSSEEAYSATFKCMKLIGGDAYLKNHWCSILHRDALSHVLLNETSDNLKLNIALMGLQHAGKKMQETVKIIRNPLFHPAQILKRMWTQRRQMQDEPTLNLYLNEYVHPSALLAAQWLEYCVLRVEFATENLFGHNGPEVVNQHIDLKRLAECVIDIYAMTACLGRASRSYCIGLQHAEYEMLIAKSYCLNAMERIKFKVRQICDGPYATNDENYRQIAKRVFKFKKYFPVHPLTRNF